jgi:two-component system, chemotaxis family, sensor kinase CheA
LYLLLSQFAEELALAIPASDQGLLALNAILMDLEAAGPSEIPQNLASLLPTARLSIDSALANGAVLTAGHLRELGECYRHMIAAVEGVPFDSSPVAAATGAAPQKQTAPPALNLSQDRELIAEFLAEFTEHISSIEQRVLILEERPGDRESVDHIFRSFHTIKGAAGLLRMESLGELTHELESLLDGVRQGRVTVTASLIEIVLGGVDVLKTHADHINAQLKGVAASQTFVAPAAQIISGARALLMLHASPDQPEEPATPSDVESPDSPKPQASLLESADVVKLHIAKLDALVDLVGELSIAQGLVVQNPVVAETENLSLVRDLRQLQRVTKELQRSVMALRTVPLAGLFRKMSRLVRDLSNQLDKPVQLGLEGGEIEMDRNVIDKMSDPLLHMIRNAIDHGIESGPERAARGKNPAATLRLSAARRGSGILFRLADDGRGIQTDILRQRAVDRGLLNPESTQTHSELLALIFHAGLSTASQVSGLSGRGVGMDVVRRNIEDLHGTISVESVPDQGTTFTVRVPLTLAIIDGLIIEVGLQRYVLPTASVCESFRPVADMIHRVHDAGELVSVRGRQTPILRLAEHFGIPARARTPCEGLLVVIESGDERRALLVDGLVAKHELVIKNLGEAFANQAWIAGATILGDGTIGLILDVDTLVHTPEVMLPQSPLEPQPRTLQ